MSLLGSCTCVNVVDFRSAPVYSNARGLRSMTSNFQTLPLCLSTPRLLKLVKKKRGRKKDLEQLSSAQQIAQHSNPDCKVECTSPQERNKQVPQESWKMYEYKKLISSDRFLPPPRLICVFPLTVLSVQCIKNTNSRNRIRFNLHYLVMQLNYALLSVLIGTYSDRY